MPTVPGFHVVSPASSRPGIRCDMMRFPDVHFSVAVLGNCDAVNAPGLARQVADLYLADSLEKATTSARSHRQAELPASPPVLTVAELGAYAGRYYSHELDVYWTIVLEGERLVAVRRRHGRSRLNPKGDDIFADDWVGPILHGSTDSGLPFCSCSTGHTPGLTTEPTTGAASVCAFNHVFYLKQKFKSVRFLKGTL